MQTAQSARNFPANAAQKSRKSSFYAAMCILPQAQRNGMFEIYSFCRAVDDIADEGGLRASRDAALGIWRGDIRSLYANTTPPNHLKGLAEAITRFDLLEADFQAVIDGMAMDVAADIRAPDFATLDLYCDRVASAVGRLSVRIFGVPDALGLKLSYHLGRALQLTNILRDLDDDAAIGRLYLPSEALRTACIESTSPQQVLAEPSIGKACEPLVTRALGHFREAQAIMAKAPRKTIRAPAIMSSVYQLILEKLIARGFTSPRAKIHLPRYRLILTLLRHGII
jgi:squalene synthase HpnD